MAKLNDRQKRFIEEYLLDLNAGAAAIRAGYSENTAYEIGYENLRKPQIASEIEKRMQDRSKKLEWTAEDIMKDLRLIAESKDEQTKDRLKAYELAGKHLKMFTDRIEAEHSGGINIMIGIPDSEEDE
jgi:phage terminase small subunit